MADQHEPSAELRPFLAEGEAALFLVESLIATLCDAGTLSREDIGWTIERALHAKQDEMRKGDAPALSAQAAEIIRRVSVSLKQEC